MSNTYKIKITKLDDFSPERIISVYKGKKEIEFEEIRYIDGVELCNKDNPTVSLSNVENEKELLLILKNKKRLKVRIK